MKLIIINPRKICRINVTLLSNSAIESSIYYQVYFKLIVSIARNISMQLVIINANLSSNFIIL